MFLIALLIISACSKVKIPPLSKSTAESSLKGYISDLKINGQIFQIGTNIVINGIFHAQAAGNYYIEVGLDPASYKSLTVLKSAQSACDQSINYAGVWYNNANAGDSIPFELTIKDYGKTGKYNVVGGVYSKCGVGADIASIEPIAVQITSSQPQTTVSPVTPTNTNNNPPAPVTPVQTCTPSGYFSSLSVRTLGTSDSGDNGIPRVAGNFHNAANCVVTYYIEAGMLQSSYKPLAVASGTPSACDGNVHFSGVKVTMQPNSDQPFVLYPQNYGVNGYYTLQGGVFYNGGKFCGNADIAAFPNTQVTSSGFSSSVVSNSWVSLI